MNYYGKRPARRPQTAGTPGTAHTADAWIGYLQRAGTARMTQVEVPDGADDAETRHAWRSAAMHASGAFRQLPQRRED